MSIQDQVSHTASPQEALLVLARALDAINVKLDNLAEQATADDKGWGEWTSPSPSPESAERAKIEVDADGNTVVDLPKVSADKQARRREFAADVLELDVHFPDLGLVEAYAKGGPLLLYYSQREFVTGLPIEVQYAMVEDVLEESPGEAEEMGRDLFRNAKGVDHEFAASAIQQIRDTL